LGEGCLVENLLFALQVVEVVQLDVVHVVDFGDIVL
jgi:hypothetical protein